MLHKIISDKAALEIEVGQPDEALRTLRFASPSYQNDLNTALVYVLKGGYDLAEAQYRRALARRPAAPGALYGLAVVAARRHDEPQLANWLRQAVAADRRLANQAVEDLEFQDYAQGEAFREALK